MGEVFDETKRKRPIQRIFKENERIDGCFATAPDHPPVEENGHRHIMEDKGISSLFFFRT